MRRILNSPEEVTHFWANKVQDEGRTRTGHCYFGGVKGDFKPEYLWSYGRHYCIGRHLPGGTVAISSRKNSSTTNGQVHRAWHAVSHLARIKVLWPDAKAADQLTDTEDLITDLLGKAKRARLNGPQYMDEAGTIARHFNLFAKALKERVRINVDQFDTWDKKMAGRAARENAVVRRAEKLRAEREIEGRAAWRTGASGYFHSPTMLRLSDRNVFDEARAVETSMGAAIPVSAAVTLWPLIQRCMKGQKDYEVGMELGHYRLTKIRTNGSIVVGCHDIDFTEIEGIAQRLGLTETSDLVETA